MSFEVKSRLSQKLMKNSEKVNVKDCLKYFNKGKVLNSNTNTSRGNIEKFKRDGESVSFFGKGKDQSFKSSLSTIYQTFEKRSYA